MRRPRPRLAEAGAAIVPAERALADAQSVWDAVVTAGTESQPAPDAYGEWRPKTPAEEAQAREAAIRAASLREQADLELQGALSARTSAHQRRSTLLAILRQIETAIA